MDNLTMFSLIVGFIAPPLVSVITQAKWSTNAKVAVMAAFSIAGGFLTAYFSNQFTGGDIVTSILITAVAAITFYEGVFKPTGIAAKIQKATTPGESDWIPLGKHSKKPE